MVFFLNDFLRIQDEINFHKMDETLQNEFSYEFNVHSFEFNQSHFVISFVITLVFFCFIALDSMKIICLLLTMHK